MAATDGAGLPGGAVTRLWDRPFGDPASTGGVEMAVKDLDGDGRPYLAFATGSPLAFTVTVYRAALLSPSGDNYFPGGLDPPTSPGIWVG